MLLLVFFTIPSISEGGHNLPRTFDACSALVGKTSPSGVCLIRAAFLGRLKDYVDPVNHTYLVDEIRGRLRRPCKTSIFSRNYNTNS